MKIKVSLFLFVVIGMVMFSADVEGVYFPQEITEEKIEEWIEEAAKYTEETTLQVSTTNHSVTKTSYDSASLVGIIFDSSARQILEEAHNLHRRYQEPEVDEMKKIVENEEYLQLQQFMIVDDRSDRSTEDMHLVIQITQFTDEGEVINKEVIQPERVVQGDAAYNADLGGHFSIKSYDFNYDNLPTHKEYIKKNFEIVAKHISALGENEIEVPWDEIR